MNEIRVLIVAYNWKIQADTQTWESNGGQGKAPEIFHRLGSPAQRVLEY